MRTAWPYVGLNALILAIRDNGELFVVDFKSVQLPLSNQPAVQFVPYLGVFLPSISRGNKHSHNQAYIISLP